MNRKPSRDGRRSFLARGGALTTAAMTGPITAQGARAAAENVPPEVPAWMRTLGRPILSPAYGQPSDFEKDVVRRSSGISVTDTAAWSFTPLQDLHGIITPNGLVFERHHAGVPAIDPQQHRLLHARVGGAAARIHHG